MPEQRHISPINSVKTAKVLYERAGSVLCRTLRYMSSFPVESTFVCGHMRTVDMYEIMCAVADYVGIGVHTYAQIADVFTMPQMYRNETEKKIEARISRAFPKASEV